MTKITYKILSVLMCIIFALGIAFLAPCSVDAATVAVPTISENEIWHGNWTSASPQIIVFEPTISGFYSLNITDHNPISNVLIEITDLTTDESFDFVYKKISDEPYNSEKLYMSGRHKYELLCYYSGDDLYDDLQADISICFKTVDFTPYQLPECPISSSRVAINFEDGVREWLKFTPNKSGDYSLNFSNSLYCYVELYDAQSGELVDARYTTFNEVVTGMEFPSQSLVFKLKQNTEYYFCMEEYNTSYTKISVSKNEKDIKSITLGSAQFDIYGMWEPSFVSEALFEHKVLYTDGSKETLSYNTAAYKGIELPRVTYIGKTAEIDEQIWMEAGKQPIAVIYDGEVKIMYIDVLAVTDLLVYENAEVLGAYQEHYIDFEDCDEHTDYWLVNMSATDLYRVNFSMPFDDVFDYYSLEIVDENNNVVKSIDENGYYWPLVAGHNYAVYFKYRYDEEKLNSDVRIYLYSGTYLPIYPDTDKNNWYYDAVTYVTGRGIMGGYGNGYFGTADGIQRQDFLVMLSRLDGVDLEAYDYESVFPDVPRGSYYEAAINWGYEHGIVTGYENGKFGVGDKITREQIVTFFYRYANYRYADTDYTITVDTLRNTYSDYGYVNDFAKEPMLWAVENGVISGKTPSTIVPYGNAQRCEVAQMMYNIFKYDTI